MTAGNERRERGSAFGDLRRTTLAGAAVRASAMTAGNERRERGSAFGDLRRTTLAGAAVRASAMTAVRRGINDHACWDLRMSSAAARAAAGERRKHGAVL
ncbi:hypothetical protein PR003_g3490 [Phytophthora rubi]|uniref:Uncharacterized protein n=1 Tax=Phytophthora rubi TaxID=129364 RepID=A0A6A3P6X6_9STRA|nr:hypothetical protein PR001_g3412 [Phytophthora rubi]KAE9354168.1 hypothetical protein PR003_g3490 [Phytophthora rubi]